MNDDSLSNTMFLPNPGGRRSPGSEPRSEEPDSAGPIKKSNALTTKLTDFSSENSLLSASADILLLAGSIKSLEPVSSVERLRADIESKLNKIVSSLVSLNCQKDVIITCRYILCCLIDELVLSTPWGVESIWSQQTLLSKFHNETWGGEKFYLIVNKLMERPERDIHLLELCYVCLSLGFKGKYRVSEQGEVELTNLSHNIAIKVSKIKPVSGYLSPEWKSTISTSYKLDRAIPKWLQAGLFSILLMTVFVIFLTNLKTRVDPVYQKLDAVSLAGISPQISYEVIFSPEDVLQQLRLDLKNEISMNLIKVELMDGEVYIRFISPALFKSGSSVVQTQYLPDVDKLVTALRKYSARITLLGHTDSTGLPQSNWVISKRRAEAVAEWIRTSSTPFNNIVIRGVADTMPLVDNDSAENRSVNRRVEIVLQLKD